MVKPEFRRDEQGEPEDRALTDARSSSGSSGQHLNAATPKKRASRALIVVAFLCIYLIWGSTYLAIKYAIVTLPPFFMAGTRFLVAGAVLFAWGSLRGRGAGGRTRPSLAQWRGALIIGGLLLLCGNGGVTWAERYIASGLAALLVATEPLWVVILNWMSGGSRPNGKVVLGLLTGLAGVALLVSGGLSGSSASAGMSLVGAGVVIAAGFAWAAGSVYSIRRPIKASTLRASGMQMLAGGTLLALLGVITGEYRRVDFHQLSWVSIGALLYLIVFGSIVAFTAYSWLLKTVTPARAATYAYVNPVVAVLLGWAIASEPLTARTLIAAGVIIASVALITIYGRKGPGAEGELSGNRGQEGGKHSPPPPYEDSPDSDPCANHPCA